MHCLVTPQSPLSQVVFVHEYVQLVFQGESFCLYNRVVVNTASVEYEQGEAGFSDSIVSLIGQHAIEVLTSREWALLIGFEFGAQVRVRKGNEVAGPEAFQFNGSNGLIIVERSE